MTDPDADAPAERISADWLTLREAADAAARESTRGPVADLLSARRPGRIVDVGCGTGSGGRWLQDQLAGDEEWVLLDHDPELLAATARRLRARGATGPISTRCDDVAGLDAILTAAQTPTLVIASALLDLLTAAQIDRLVAGTARHRTPMLLALTVTGAMTADPPHPDDHLVSGAFDRHQRRGGRCGPQAAATLEQAAQARGLLVDRLGTPWILDAAVGDDAALLEQLVPDRARAAAEQLAGESSAAPGARDETASDPDRARRWGEARLAQIRSGALRLRIDHVDVLVRDPADGARRGRARDAAEVGGACGT
ncbi:methyltransferase domain-containing protein [Nesterenkonia sp. F]|uniref:methyltransferase domain-containing protein n=1 Tax=Nesterenkonia sp. F TaxID=795955 RepID=UPI00130392DC|nr:methyltransferase domain-containing protein [Nesterenkonia sp. F]